MATKKVAKKVKSKKVNRIKVLLKKLSNGLNKLENVLDDLEAARNEFEETGGDGIVDGDADSDSGWS